MTYVILDLEWNGAFSKKERKFINEIIEFGAVKLDENLRLTDRFSMLVTPQIGKKLSGKITQLTHISFEELENAHNTFMHAASVFGKFAADSVVLTWGQSDIHALMENYEYYEKNSTVGFLERYCDLQSYCASMMGIYDKSKQIGLLTCAEDLKINTEAFERHRAQDDAELSAVCFQRLYDPVNFPEFVELCNDEFYRKMSFRTTYITDINNPLIDSKSLEFTCPECGKPTVQTKPWSTKNKHLRSEFKCPKCGYEFIGRITFRLKYEGLQINKRTTKKIIKEENEPPED